jgi:hypothetical protein
MKVDTDLKVPSICCIPHKCADICIIQMDCTTETKYKEYAGYICLFQPDKLEVTEHSSKAWCIMLTSTEILDS